MDSLKKMNEALDYIEDNLAGDIIFKEAAKLACCSEYHFTRMFSFLAGITLSEYIRRRRLTLAAFELGNSNIKIIDMAVKYGYNSADSFARAFQNLHGITPSEARSNGHLLKAYPRMAFQFSIKGGKAMEYRMVDKEAFRIVGIKDRVPIVFSGENPGITAMWQRLDKEMISQLKELSDIEPRGIINASVNFSAGRMEEKGGFDHYIGAATSKSCPEGFASLEVSASTWAVFEIMGSAADAQNAWGCIFAEWFPSSGYELAEGPEIFWYDMKNAACESFKSEIWIPVCKQ